MERYILKSISPGFYSLDWKKPIFTKDNLVVAVHPYFDVEQGARSQEYLSKIDEFIGNFPGIIITLEEAEKVDETAIHYYNLGCKNNRFFIRTKENLSEPLEMDYFNLFNKFNELRGNKPIDLIGGFFYERNLSNWNNWCGCFGSLARRLKEKEIPINLKHGLIFE